MWWRIALLLGIVARCWVATWGWNYDLESFQLVAQIGLAGDCVYNETPRYNYGISWFALLTALKWLQLQSGMHDIASFHLWVAGLLSLVDAATAILLRRWYGNAIGWTFWLNPIGLLLTGFHSQMDNFAVLWALVAWRWLPTRPHWNALFMGLSLIQKHIFIFFPITLFFNNQLTSWRSKFLYCLISYGLFIGHFIVIGFSADAWAGIWQNVFQYGSFEGIALLPLLGKWLIPIHWFKFIFIISLLTISSWSSWKFPRHAFALYAVAMVALSSAMVTQYLAIPLVAIAMYPRVRMGWIYTAVATLFLSLRSPTNIGGLPIIQLFFNDLPFQIVFKASLSVYACQLCLLAWCLEWIWRYYHKPVVFK